MRGFCLKIIITFSLLSISFLSTAQDYFNQRPEELSESEFFKAARDAYREQRKVVKDRAKLKKASELRDSNICVDCNQIKNLVHEVNKGLFFLAKNLDKEDPKQNTIEHVEALEAMFHYTMVTNELGEKNCYKKTQSFGNSFLDESYAKFEEDESEIIFSNMVPLSSLEAIHLRDGKKRTYFYRGAPPDRDVVVKVQIDESERARVTYYRMEMSPTLINGIENEKEIEEIKKETAMRNSAKKRWGGWFENKSDSGSDYFNYGAGFELEHDDYLPKRITLLKGESLTPLTESFSFKTKAELSTKRVRTNISLTDSRGEEYFEVEMKPSKAELKVPTKIDIFSTGYKLKSSVMLNTDREQGIDFEILGSKKNRNKIEIMSTERGMAYSVENQHMIDSKQSVSFKFSNDEEQGSAVFLRYELKL
jgi:hypothetical protein